MNDENITESKPDESAEPKPESQQNIFFGIVGNSTNHDLVMTRLWISNNIIENIEIKVIGSDFTKSIAARAAEHIKGKSIADTEFITDFEPDVKHGEESNNLDIVYESIIQALADFHKPRESSDKTKTDVEPPSSEDSPEEKPVEETET